jgi:hypothetical protein
MEELIEKANRAMLETQWLRNEGRSLRDAAVRVSELGQTLLELHAELPKGHGLRRSIVENPAVADNDPGILPTPQDLQLS